MNVVLYFIEKQKLTIKGKVQRSSRSVATTPLYKLPKKVERRKGIWTCGEHTQRDPNIGWKSSGTDPPPTTLLYLTRSTLYTHTYWYWILCLKNFSRFHVSRKNCSRVLKKTSFLKLRNIISDGQSLVHSLLTYTSKRKNGLLPFVAPKDYSNIAFWQAPGQCLLSLSVGYYYNRIYAI